MQGSANIILNRILITAAKRKASSVHLSVNAYPTLRVDSELVELKEEVVLTREFLERFAEEFLDENQKKELETNKGVIFVREFAGKFRFKVNLFYQKGVLAAALFLIPAAIPLLVNLGLPKVIYGLTGKKNGLIVIAGPYGSGRTTTMVAIVEEINKDQKENVLIIEKPIEYIFANKESLIEQREVGRDVNSFTSALQYCQGTDVDVVAVGVNNEVGVMPLVLDLASSAKLVICQLDTISVIQTVEEILASFPSAAQSQAQSVLADSLLAIVVQRLVPKIGGGLVLASEVLIATQAVRSLIKEGRLKQITTIMQSSRTEGMSTLDQSLADLVRAGEVLIDQAVNYATNPESLRSIAKS
ncbi:MAG: hypothetical protein A3A24_03055 [Candidatus Buchananbacteria bacterium RIFCSPLOWO2_01_FULL_46_12]|uniref:Bacterial type II secretion system protein E domain-containing protein n=2 Tax=Candidatus Buchananiibacteriota TaxID=1817903 RepID=A0A1G1YRG8_9BACT|nr:MAG: hypothetical protein A2744_02745 [Candidatus Buchananbacteria bacterium RIFCSPHIGHO2_01_FULL_44_11]OGY54017.1 MAG: hypothetical protein A3A24_03055 [Candidatus Buchananbacteria bacterium RIFCSPLOWO2_01_FULL_46_12]